MGKFKICVTEVSRVYYVVEAESKSDAEERFSDWLDDEKNLQDVYYDMEKSGYDGMDYEAVEAHPDEEIDIQFSN